MWGQQLLMGTGDDYTNDPSASSGLEKMALDALGLGSKCSLVL